MFVDARELAADELVETDVCVIGSGPAGMTLAKLLSGHSFRVCVLESGGFAEPDPATRSLSEVEHTGRFVQVTPDQRNRRFGGNAGYWGVRLKHTDRGVRLLPFQRSDFEHRKGVPHSGWPLTREQLDPYYARAQELLDVGPYSYDPSAWTSATAQPLPFKEGSLQTTMFMFGNGHRITQDHRQEMASSSTTSIYCYANALELQTDETGQWVRKVRAATVLGNTFTVTAKMVIVATGGVESTHLLLLSNKVHKSGLGNHHGVLGRYFMDHPLVEGGIFYPRDRSLFERSALYDKRDLEQACVMGGLTLSDRAIREHQTLNLTSWIFPRPAWYGRADAIRALRRLTRGGSLKRGVGGLLTDLTSVIEGRAELAESAYAKLAKLPEPFWSNLSTGGWSHVADKRRTYGVFEVLHMVEQAPDPENRLTLGDSTDALGRRNIRLTSKWRELDQLGVDRGQALLDRELRASGLGHFEPRREQGQLLFASGGASHHMGTTRMSASARSGVVDDQCRVHGVENLYIASSSVFPTGSAFNPTLTVMALAARIAEAVKLRVSGPLRAEAA